MLSRRSFLAASAAPLFAQKNAPAPRPSIVLAVAEDIGSWMLGCYGNAEIKTPNIDRLASAGARFVNSFAAQPGPASGLAPLLTQAGYTCGEARADADAFLARQQKSTPFFLHLTLAAEPAQKHLDIYANSRFDSFQIRPAAPNATAGKDILAAPLAHLRREAARVSAIDDQLAALQRTLISRGLFENTLLIFTSTGGVLLGRHGLWGAAHASTPVNMFDEVVAVPMIWQWPGRVPTFESRAELVAAYDLLPTLCEAAGAQPPAKRAGRSFLPIATKRPLPKKQPWIDLVFSKIANAEMARDNYYKLILRDNGQGPNELYDIRKDPREMVNQYDNAGFVTVRERLTRALSDFRARTL